MSQPGHNAYGTSIALHMAAVAAIAIIAYSASVTKPLSPKVLELVAGEGNNYAATAAPAIGTPGVKLNMPATPTPPAPEVRPEPQPPIEAAPPEPAQQAPITAPPPVPAKTPPKPAKKTPAKTPPKPVSPENLHLDKDFKRIENKRANRLVNQYMAQKAALEKKLQAQEIARLKAARVDVEGISKGVVGGSTENKEGGAGGKALTREEQDLLSSYFAMLEARVKENHISPDGASEALACKVSFYVSADGTISRVHIARSSGNSAFDQSVIEAFNKTGGVGPRPDHRGDEQIVEFSMREEGN